MTAVSSGDLASYCAVDPTAFTDTQIDVTPFSTTYTGYLTKNYFKSNTFDGNFYTGGKSLI